MTKRMLIDGNHPEETRVVITNANRLEEYDVETSTKVQLKGNIYLAKVTRVEPSLQAAFVDYGGNRHGFLAFSEIHPDYFQIPVEDREALFADEAELENMAQAAQAHVDEIDGGVEGDGDDEAAHDDASPDDEPRTGDEHGGDGPGADAAGSEEAQADGAQAEGDAAPANDGRSRKRDGQGDKRRSFRRYKIQEVIKRRQIILVQVVKEERGNKGAALTTYLSLAGRYCVLMPNAARGGGVSRKITNATDRRRLKDLIASLDVPEGMGVIMRTAGMERNKAEIKRDFDYLMRVWEEVRETTLSSAAPALVYEEGNLIKRAIRDLYSRDIDEILVEGADAYQAAKKLMRLMMPSHAKRVQQYRDDTIPLLHRFQVETQLEAMHTPVVQLKSGGYIVINPTEALVAIDVNSGRSTRERNIEETAVNTNLEAATEIARQLRLRDLAGLIVIDFIDMEEGRNQRAVEKRFKDAVKTDRARIQLGRISNFGLLEMSRQRLRPSLIETSSNVCPHCGGAGYVRSTESTSVHVLRMIEEEGIRKRSSEISVAVPTAIALYILNQKRAWLTEIERRYGFHVLIIGDDSLIPPDMRLERIRGRVAGEDEERPAIPAAPEHDAETEAAEADDEAAAEAEAGETGSAEETGRKEAPSRRRRGRRRRRKDGAEAADEARHAPEEAEAADADGEEAGEEVSEGQQGADGTGDEDDTAGERQPRRRRRGRRGGRKRAQTADGDEDTSLDPAAEGAARADALEAGADAPTVDTGAPTVEAAEAVGGNGATAPARDDAGSAEDDAVSEAAAERPQPEPEPEPEPRTKAEPEAEAEAEPEPEPTPEPALAGNGEAKEDDVAKKPGEGAPGTAPNAIGETAPQPARRGWWQRLIE